MLNCRGIISANLLPFKPDYSIDKTKHRCHFSWLTNVRGVTAITRGAPGAMAIAVDEVGHRVPLIAAILTDSTM